MSGLFWNDTRPGQVRPSHNGYRNYTIKDLPWVERKGRVDGRSPHERTILETSSQIHELISVSEE